LKFLYPGRLFFALGSCPICFLFNQMDPMVPLLSASLGLSVSVLNRVLNLGTKFIDLRIEAVPAIHFRDGSLDLWIMTAGSDLIARPPEDHPIKGRHTGVYRRLRFLQHLSDHGSPPNSQSITDIFDKVVMHETFFMADRSDRRASYYSDGNTDGSIRQSETAPDDASRNRSRPAPGPPIFAAQALPSGFLTTIASSSKERPPRSSSLSNACEAL
jgi:hypothetical protein